MSKKTLLLIIVLLVITAGLLYVAFRPATQNVQYKPPPIVATPTPVAQTMLSLSPASYVIASPSGSLNVTVDTGQNKVNAVQIELGFDPQAFSVIDIIAGKFFDNPVVLLKNVDLKNGKISFALALPPTAPGKTGTGTVAVINFTTTIASGGKTELSLLPKSSATADKVKPSVLKKATGATIFYVQEVKAATESGQDMMGPFKPATTSGQ